MAGESKGIQIQAEASVRSGWIDRLDIHQCDGDQKQEMEMEMMHCSKYGDDKYEQGGGVGAWTG